MDDNWDTSLGINNGGNINADPLFYNPAAGDFRLTAYSPCADAGNNSAVPAGITTDFEGDPRFFNNGYADDTGNGTPPIVDMGADEWNDVGGPVNPTPEAATIVLLGTGLLGLGGFIWWRRRRRHSVLAV